MSNNSNNQPVTAVAQLLGVSPDKVIKDTIAVSALRMRLEGMELEEIAKQLGRTPSEIMTFIKKHLRNVKFKDGQHYYELEMLRLDHIVHRLYKMLDENSNDVNMSLKIIDRIISVSNTRISILSRIVPDKNKENPQSSVTVTVIKKNQEGHVDSISRFESKGNPNAVSASPDIRKMIEEGNIIEASVE